MTEKEAVGGRLRAPRQTAGMTQRTAAKAAGPPLSNLRNCEQGKSRSDRHRGHGE